MIDKRQDANLNNEQRRNLAHIAKGRRKKSKLQIELRNAAKKIIKSFFYLIFHCPP